MPVFWLLPTVDAAISLGCVPTVASLPPVQCYRHGGMPPQNRQYLNTLLFLGGESLLSNQRLPPGAIQKTAQVGVDYWDKRGGSFLNTFKTEATFEEAVKYSVISLNGLRQSVIAKAKRQVRATTIAAVIIARNKRASSRSNSLLEAAAAANGLEATAAAGAS